MFSRLVVTGRGGQGAYVRPRLLDGHSMVAVLGWSRRHYCWLATLDEWQGNESVLVFRCLDCFYDRVLVMAPDASTSVLGVKPRAPGAIRGRLSLRRFHHGAALLVPKHT